MHRPDAIEKPGKEPAQGRKQNELREPHAGPSEALPVRSHAQTIQVAIPASSRQCSITATVVAKLGTLIAVLLLASVAAGCGGASSPRDAVSSFVLGYVDHNTDNCCETGMHATAASGRPDGTDFLVVRKAASTWQVIGFGKGAIGCRVLARIRAELAAGVPEDVLGCPTP